MPLYTLCTAVCEQVETIPIATPLPIRLSLHRYGWANQTSLTSCVYDQSRPLCTGDHVSRLAHIVLEPTSSLVALPLVAYL